MIEVTITGGQLAPITQAVDGLIARFSDLRPLANAIGWVVWEDNREARVQGMDRFDIGLTEVKSQSGRPGSGPPLAPRGPASRVVAGFEIDVQPAGPTAYLVVGAWPSMPFLRCHADGEGRYGAIPVRDVIGIRDSAAGPIGERVRAFADGTLVDPGAPPRAQPGGYGEGATSPIRGPRKPKGGAGAGRAKKARAGGGGGGAAAYEESGSAGAYGPSTARVKAIDQDEKELLRDFQKLVPKATSLQDIASIVGAPEGSQVSMTPMEREMWVTTRGPGLKMYRVIHSSPAGPYIENQLIEIAKTGKGAGSRIFAQQVENAARLGVDRIVATASGDMGFNGYYTWARLGYDGPLPRDLVARPAGMEGARRISELMATPAGRDWWKLHGKTTNMEFDVREGSASRQILDAYMAEKAKAASKGGP